jgi:hypothetical protein
MASEINPDLKGGSRDSLCEVIINTLKENAFNHDLFLSNQMFHGNVSTLFEARNCEVQEFAERLWAKIAHDLSASLSNWLVIFPLVRVKPISGTLGDQGLSILSPFDKAKWTQLSNRYKINPDWDPTIGGTEKANLKYFLKNHPFTWLACEVTAGTMDAGRELAGRRMRMFIAAVFAVLYRKEKRILNKSMMHVTSYSIQFPAEGSAEGRTEIMAPIGELFPPLLSEVELSNEDLDDLKNWYGRVRSSSIGIQTRVSAAAQFTNYAIVAEGLERFVHFFISLDALFGERGKVEKTITNGLKHIYQTESNWDYRAPKLFDLRSSLVHGAYASIDEWDELPAYRRHTASDPLQDVTDASLRALWLFPGQSS